MKKLQERQNFFTKTDLSHFLQTFEVHSYMTTAETIMTVFWEQKVHEVACWENDELQGRPFWKLRAVNNETAFK